MVTNGKMKKLVDKYNEIKAKEVEVAEEKEKLRTEILAEINKEYPDEKRGARIEVGDYNVIRSAAAKVKWDNTKFKTLIGDTLYQQSIDVVEKVNEKKVDVLVKEGKIDMKDVTKSSSVTYSTRLLINLKSEDTSEGFESK